MILRLRWKICSACNRSISAGRCELRGIVLKGFCRSEHKVKISPFLFIFHHLTYIRKSLYYSAF